MTIEPDYQRQGAGRVLLKWGTDIAEELGVEPSITVLANSVFEADHR